MKQRILLFIPSYNCSGYIGKVLKKFPQSIWDQLSAVIVVDDASKDETSKKVLEFKTNQKVRGEKIQLIINQKNLGYGGVQKLMYDHAIKNKFDYVIMLHGDDQHDPRELPAFLAKINEGADFTTGSRVLGDALGGGMPFYKYVGNKCLTGVENIVLGTRISDLHCGYRAIRVNCLKRIPYRNCSNNYLFDNELIFQFVAKGYSVTEIPVSTHYEDQASGVRIFHYGSGILKSLIEFSLSKYRLRKSKKYVFS